VTALLLPRRDVNLHVTAITITYLLFLRRLDDLHTLEVNMLLHGVGLVITSAGLFWKSSQNP